MRTGTNILFRAGVVAAVYLAVTVSLQPISYGPIQLRLGEALKILVLTMGEPAFLGTLIGNFLANLFSPFGLYDVVCGFLATSTGGLLTLAIRRKVGVNAKGLLLTIIAVSLSVGIFIGVVLLSYFAGAGDPLKLFALLTAEEAITLAIGSVAFYKAYRKALGE